MSTQSQQQTLKMVDSIETPPESSHCSVESEQSSAKTSHSSAPPAFEHLSPSQTQAFVELKALCDQNGEHWYRSETEGDSNPQNEDDDTLLRYLRARQYDPHAAYKQFTATTTWRKKMQLDDSYDNVEVKAFEAIRRMFPQWIGRRDKNGVPIFNYVVGQIRPEDLVSTTKNDPELRCVFLPAEYSMRFVMPLCGKMHEDGIMSKSVNLIDLSGVGVKHFWNLRHHLQKSSTMATAHYPETVEKIFIIGAPSFFPTIWGFITKWFDAATTSKISVLSASEVKPTLEKYIDPENIPKRYGGTLDWDYNMFPILDEEAALLLKDMMDGWVEGPLRCIVNNDEHVLLAVGSEGAKTRRDVLGRMPMTTSKKCS